MRDSSHRLACRRLLALPAVAALFAATAAGGIVYDAAVDAYRVVDYPEAHPCTLTLLAQMDALLGVGKMTRDAETGVRTLSCNLAIGANDGTETYFRIGTPERPRETLVLRGNLYVCPYYVAGENPHERWWHAPQRVNRLTLGHVRNPDIRATLKFDASTPPQERWLVTGERPGPGGAHTIGHGGQLVVRNGLITALQQSKGGEIAGLRLRGDGFVFINSTLSWVKGMMTYGGYPGWRKLVQVEGSTFAHGGVALVGGKHELSNCRLVACDTAVLDYGSVDVVLENCTFESNRHNWRLRFPGRGEPGLVCIDCDIGPPQAGNPMSQDKTASIRKLEAKGVPLRNPQFLSQRHVVVRVLDAAGRPAPDAEVAIRAEQPGAGIDEGRRYRTDAAGCTPRQACAQAVLLPERRQTVAAGQAEPPIETFSYVITARADGRSASASGFRPDRSWKTVTLTLGGD